MAAHTLHPACGCHWLSLRSEQLLPIQQAFCRLYLASAGTADPGHGNSETSRIYFSGELFLYKYLPCLWLLGQKNNGFLNQKCTKVFMSLLYKIKKLCIINKNKWKKAGPLKLIFHFKTIMNAPHSHTMWPQMYSTYRQQTNNVSRQLPSSTLSLSFWRTDVKGQLPSLSPGIWMFLQGV